MNMFRAFMELDEAYSERQEMINEIKKLGKYYNFETYTDAQIYSMLKRLQNKKKVKKPIEPKHELDLSFEDTDPYSNYCDCGSRLSDAGFCPVCDDGHEVHKN